jgi:hypothetical protein
VSLFLQRLQLKSEPPNLPTIQLSGKATVFGFAGKAFGHDLFCKEFAVSNNESFAMWEPTNSPHVRFI